MNTALLVIDLQNGLCSGVEAAHDIDNVVARIDSLAARARTAGAPVVLIQHEEDWAEGLVYGSTAWELTPGLRTEPADLRVRKRTPNSFHGTDLDALLRARGITRVVVCGLQTEFCVDTTVRQALPLGYDVVLAADAHSTPGGVLPPEGIVAHHNTILGAMGMFGPRIDVVPAETVSFTP